MEEEKIFVVKEISEMKDDKNINDDHDNEFPFFHDNEDNDVEKNANIEEEKNINEPEINENIIQESKIGKIQEENNEKENEKKEESRPFVENFYVSNQKPISANVACENFGRYYILNPKREKITTFDPNKVCAKIKIIKTNMEGGEREYLITNEGVYKSEKNTNTEEIMIGRQQSTSEGIIPNDIVLPTNDRAISRIHCKIISENFFLKHKINDRNLALLMMTHPRLGKNSPGKNLPLYIFRILFDFLREKPVFYIVDVGSIYGTYLKLKPRNAYKLDKGQIYLIGSDTTFIIKEKINPSNENECKSTNDNLLRYLASEKKIQTTIHGLTEIEENQIEKILSESFEKEINETQNISELMFSRPLLKIEFPSSGRIAANSHIFLANGQDCEFIIGRSAESTIPIPLNTISRKQCKIYYFGGEWVIIDGDIQGGIYRESSNGTWISLVDYRLKADRQESDPKILEDDTDIKISDTILKFEYPKMIKSPKNV